MSAEAPSPRRGTHTALPRRGEHAREYWRDVGTLDSYYEASTDLVSVEPRLNLERTVCSSQVRLHSHAEAVDSVLVPGVDVGRGARLRRCIVDKAVRIPPGEVIGEDPPRDRKRFTVSEGWVVVCHP